MTIEEIQRRIMLKRQLIAITMKEIAMLQDEIEGREIGKVERKPHNKGQSGVAQ